MNILIIFVFLFFAIMLGLAYYRLCRDMTQNILTAMADGKKSIKGGGETVIEQEKPVQKFMSGHCFMYKDLTGNNTDETEKKRNLYHLFQRILKTINKQY